MIRRISAIVLSLALALVALPAWAGGLIIINTVDERVGGQSGGLETWSSPGDAAELSLGLRFAPRPPGRPPVQVSGVETSPLLAEEEFYEEYAYEDVGCGGAQAASGPMGALPLAIAGLALLLRRRRR